MLNCLFVKKKKITCIAEEIIVRVFGQYKRRNMLAYNERLHDSYFT